jgi:hypothetical protein
VYGPGNDLLDTSGGVFQISVTTTDDETVMRGKGYTPELAHKSHFDFHPGLRELLNVNDCELLKARTMHHFYRHFAYFIPPHLQDLFLGTTLEKALTSKKCKEEYLDWQIMRAHLTLNLPRPGFEKSLARDIHDRLNRVAQALGSMHRWEEAARILVEIGHAFEKTAYSIEFFQAAKAFHHAGLYDDALKDFLRHLGRLVADGETINTKLNQDPFTEVLGGMMLVHQAQLEAQLAIQAPNNRSGCIVLTEDAQMAFAFVGLLLASGISFISKDIAEQIFGVPVAYQKSLLKVQYRQPKMANRELLKLVRSGSFDQYKENLLRLLDPKPFPFRGKINKSMSEDLREFLAGGAAKSAQTIKRDDHDFNSFQRCVSCWEWGKTNEGMLNCQCGKVYYCSTACQEADWQKHQKSCSWHQMNAEECKPKESSDKQGKKKKDGSSSSPYTSDYYAICSVCKKPSKKEEIKSCPCHGRKYCGKACQVRDWKEHKKVFPFHLAKKQKESSA